MGQSTWGTQKMATEAAPEAVDTEVAAPQVAAPQVAPAQVAAPSGEKFSIAKLNISDSVQIEFADEGALKLSTQCYCCVQSFFIDYPACCGIQYDNQCYCCTEAQSSKCMQIEESTKAWDTGVSEARCIDYTGGDMVLHEAACQSIKCCCITGIKKSWCGVKDLKPLFCKGNQLCIDQRCALPPTADTVPAGISICGMKLWGEGAGSCKGA